MDVTVTGFEYVETLPVQETTPLGMVSTTDVPCDRYRVTISVGPIVGHWIWLAPEALGDRIAGYGLDDADVIGALEAIVRETVFPWDPTMEPADASSAVDVRGGVDARINVLWGKNVQEAAAPILASHADRIAPPVDPPAPPDPPAVAPSPPPDPPAVEPAATPETPA
jgi:hypothetical protein